MAGPSKEKPPLIREGIDVIDLDRRRPWTLAGWLLRFGLTLFFTWAYFSGEWRTIARTIVMSYRELARGSPLALLECRAGDVQELRFSEDRERLLALYDGGAVRTWRLRTQQATDTRPDGQLIGGVSGVRMLLMGRDFDDRISTAEERALNHTLEAARKSLWGEGDGTISFHSVEYGDGPRGAYLETLSRLRSLQKPWAVADDGTFELYATDLNDYVAGFTIRAVFPNDPTGHIRLSASSPFTEAAAAATGRDVKVTACAMTRDRRYLALSWTIGAAAKTAVWELPKFEALPPNDPPYLEPGDGPRSIRLNAKWQIDHFDLPPDKGTASHATALSLSDDGTRLAIACGSTIWVYAL